MATSEWIARRQALVSRTLSGVRKREGGKRKKKVTVCVKRDGRGSLYRAVLYSVIAGYDVRKCSAVRRVCACAFHAFVPALRCVSLLFNHTMCVHRSPPVYPAAAALTWPLLL